MAPTDALLAISAEWPERAVETGEIVMAEGDATRQLLVLVDGSLEVRRGEETVAVIDQPGACIGEISLLLDHEHHATVVAASPCRVRVLDDAHDRLAADPDLLLPVASILASRLRLVTAYLADLKEQYGGDRAGLDMVGDVLGSLTSHQGNPIDPGSDREPDSPY